MIRSAPTRRSIRHLEQIIISLAILIDLVLIIFADAASFTLRFETHILRPPPVNFLDYLRIAWFIISLRLCCCYIFGLYYQIKSKTIFEIITACLQAATVSTIIIVVGAFYFRALAYPRSVIFLSWLLTTSFLTLWHLLIYIAQNLLMGGASTNIVIIGVSKAARTMGYHITKDATIHYKVLGYIMPVASARPHDLPILGSLSELPRILRNHSVDEIIVASKVLSRRQLSNLFTWVENRRITLKVIPDLYEAVIGNLITTKAGTDVGIAIATSQTPFHWYHGLKRIIDVAVSAIILILFSPVILLVTLLIKITSYGPVIFRQERIGLHGTLFTLYKFRTMYSGAEDASGPVWTKPHDPRITPLGKFMRLTRLDELPQLVNVFRNEMSIVGPRPERPHFVKELIKEIPFYAERLEVKPGITGWAQVCFEYADSLEASREKLLYDIFYIKNMSLALDVYIFIKTIWVVLQEKGAH